MWLGPISATILPVFQESMDSEQLMGKHRASRLHLIAGKNCHCYPLSVLKYAYGEDLIVWSKG